MSKLDSILYLYAEKIDALPEDKRRSLDSKLKKLSVGEVVSYMNMQAELHASGQISTEDAMFLYNTIKDWENASLPARVVTLEIMAAYAQKKINNKLRVMKSRKAKSKKRTTSRRREDNPWKIVATTPRFDGGAGGRPFRYVTLEWNKGGRTEYSRHMEVEDGEMYYGHYYQRKEDAIADMNQSYKNELSYSKPLKTRKVRRRSVKRKN